MIGIPGQYVVTFSVGDQVDFIAEDELKLFNLIEEAGNSMPTFEMDFITPNEDILPLLHEDNNISCSYGIDPSNLFTTTLTVMKVESNRVGENRRQIHVKGLFASLDYLGNTNVFLSAKKSAVEVMTDIGKKNFGSNSVISNITASQDSQVWVQAAKTDRSYVNDLWLHADMGNSFLAMGISSDGKFIIKDVLQELNGTYTWRFTDRINDPTTDIVYDGDPAFSFDTSLTNNWVGYSRNKLVYNIEAGTSTFVKEVAEPALSINQQLVKKASITNRFAASGIQNYNVHANYWPAYMKNVASLAAFSSMKLTLVSSGRFFPVRVLDLAMYLEESVLGTTDGPSTSSAEYHSGNYLVTKVSRSIFNKTFVTLVQLCREAPNRIQVAGS